MLQCERARAFVDGCGTQRVGYGGVLGALLGGFGLGSRAGRVCQVCIPQVGIRVPVRLSSAQLTLCSFLFRWSV